MAISAAEIGEKVAVGQAALNAVEMSLGASNEPDDNVSALVTDLMHFLAANGYDARSVVNEAWNQFEADHKGPVL